MISSKVFIGDGSTKVFPIDFEILGENYVQIWIDDIPINDKTKYDIINNSIVFNDDNIPAIDVKIIITVATTAQEIADLNAPPSGIDIVSDNIDNVNTVATDINSVKTNSDNIDSIKTNATSIADINTVATDINSVKTNSDNIESIKTNATNIDNININATNIADINTNASNIDSINTNATNIDSINTVSDDLNLTDSNTKIVATNIDNVNIVGENITDVETFAKVYQNAHAEDIDVRTDGSALQVGDLYFNTTIKKMKVYDGTTWQLASSAINGMLKKLTFTGDGTTTTFVITDGYDANYAEVYLNGTNVTADVDISDGQNIVFSAAPADGDEILGVFFGSFVLADCYTKAEADIAFAKMNGNSTEVFEVANAVKDTQAVNKGQTLQKIQTDLTVTVGSTGDFATINEAIIELSKAYPIYKQLGYNVEIKLLSGFVMEEQIIVNGIDLGWITITGEDDETVISRDALTISSINPFDNVDSYSAFYVVNGVLPNIGQLFNMDTSGDVNSQNGIKCMHSKVFILSGAGIKNTTRDGIYCKNSIIYAKESIFTGCSNIGISANNSLIYASYCDISGSYFGINAGGASIVEAYGANASNTGTYAIFASTGSTIDFTYGTATNTGNYSCYAIHRSNITAYGSNCTNSEATTTNEYVVSIGGMILMNNASGDTATNIDVNTLTSSGIIFN